MLNLTFIFVFLAMQQQLSASPLIVNIDSPQFRRLVVAVPSIVLDPEVENSDTARYFVQQGAEELSRLLVYTGLFNRISQVAYGDIPNKGVEPSLVGKKGLDFSQWKAVGVESLVHGEIKKDGQGEFLEMRTFDIRRQKLVVGKRYRELSKAEMPIIMRRYANWIMEAYTGKPGIFNSKIVFVGRVSNGAPKQIFVCDFDGANVRQITKANATHISPHFSPDGRKVTYTSFKRRNPDLYIYDLKSGKEEILSRYQGLNSGAQWSQSGKLIAYTGSKNGDTDIFTLDPISGMRRKLIRGHGLDVDPTFSPDGKYLAFVSGRYGNPHIFLATLKWSGANAVKVVSDSRLTYAGWYNSTPAWSPDSKNLVFAGYDKDINRYDIFTMAYNGKNLERLTLKTGDNESPTFAPNGQMIAFQSNRVGGRDVKGAPQLWVMSRDGSGQRRINTGLYEAQTPSWSGALYDAQQSSSNDLE